ncbi:MAG: RidA family protein [Proteobacteria bacterium]|jgi:2-iminobutanoate/2-iminopropanoate deaminase|nr:RidA family protein [Pseudomonadota bacterium]
MKKVIKTTGAPAAIGPYSQAIGVGDMVYASGQIPLDPKSMEMVGTTVEEQTEQVLKNLSAVLEAEGLGLKHLVKTTVFLKNMGDFPKFNAVYEKHMVAPYPARATVEVSALPKGALVEIEGIACRES